MNAKDQILALIETKPKHYTVLIKKDAVLLEWVMMTSTAVTDRLQEHIYSALSGETNVCVNGSMRTVSRISEGWVGCGPAATCACTAANISKNVTKSKQLVTAEQHTATNSKREQTMVEKYGVKFNSQREEVKTLLAKPRVSAEAYAKLTDRVWMTEQYVTQQRNLVDIADELGVYYGTVGVYCHSHGFALRRNSNYSLAELKIQEFIESLGFTCTRSNYGILEKHELDLYVAEKKVAVEHNGLYWHSGDQHRHLSKSVECEELGIQLFHVTDWEWTHKQEIIKSMLRSKLGMCRRVYARKCSLSEVSSREARAFLNENHLQGWTASSYYLGLYEGKTLVMMVSAGRSRFDKASSVELHRLAAARGVTVVGGGTRLLKHLQTLVSGPIISYCDRAKSTGAGYLAMGFELVRTTAPGYFWTNGTEVISRFQCQRTRLKRWLVGYDSALNERANMTAAGFKQYWDCGNWVFLLPTRY
jgi:hypothetical protein